MTALPLANIRVLDLTAHRAGPTAVRQFADWGAQVIKIEQPGESKDATGSSRHGFDFQNLHRNKRSMTLNLKTDQGRAIFMQLAKTADLVVENYRSDVKHRLGVDYDAVAKVNPRIIYGSLAGFGQTGPDAKRPGVDQIAQGMGGLMSITGLPGQGPVRVGIPIADLTSGLLLAQAMMMALYERETSGKGQWVQSSLLASMIAMMDFQAARWLVEGEVPGQAGNDHPTSMPTSVYPTADGYVNIAASGNPIFARMCGAFGVPELAKRPDFASAKLRSLNRVALNEAISEQSRRYDSTTLIALLADAGVPCGPIYKMDEVFADPQVRHLGMAVPVPKADGGNLTLVGPAIALSRTPARMKRTAGPAGEHNDEILRELGYGDAEIAGLRAAKII